MSDYLTDDSLGVTLPISMTKLPSFIQITQIFASNRISEMAIFGLDKLQVLLPEMVVAGEDLPDNDFPEQLAAIEYDFNERPSLPLV